MPRTFSLDGYGPSKPAGRRQSRSDAGTRTIFDDAHTIPKDTLFDHIRSYQQTGDTATRNIIVTANLGLIPKIALRYLGRGVEFHDLVQYGVFGLMKAAKRFDCDRGWQFSTYASRCIKTTISRALIEEGTTIYVPSHQYEKRKKIKKFSAEWTTGHDDPPTLEEVAMGTELSTRQIRECAWAHHVSYAFSGDVITDDWQSPTTDKLVLNYEDLARAKAMLRMEQRLYRDYPLALIALRTDPCKRDILQRFLGLNGYPPAKSLKDVGDTTGLSRERPRQIANELANQLALIHMAWSDYRWYLGHEARAEALKRVIG